MKKLIIIIIILSSGWYGYTHYKQQGLSLLSKIQEPFKALSSDKITKCITVDGKTLYGKIPQGTKCVTKERIQGAITIIPSNASSDTEENHSANTFNCDGKTHCSQMSSCKEALFYISNCPNTEMDGDGDGTPCEQQWCN